MKPRLPRGLYLIADTSCGDPVAQVELAVRSGLRLVQLRAKELSPPQVEELTRACLRATAGSSTALVLNDHVDLACRLPVAGVHLGQEDCPLPRARALLGPDRLLGWSAHTAAQLARAAEPDARADYVGVGPVFATSTKETGRSALGLDGLRALVQASTVPVVAIGGIGHADIPSLIGAGVHGWAAISAVWGAADPADAIRRLQGSTPKEARGS